jgi:hypothetical protein
LRNLKDLHPSSHGKLRYDLIPTEGVDGAALALTIGAVKHAPRGWETGADWGHYFRATLSHLWAFWRGEEYDTDGKHHLDGAIASAMILRAMVARRIGTDDRKLTAKAKRFIADKMKNLARGQR